MNGTRPSAHAGRPNAHFFRHPREGGDPSFSGSGWIPAFAGMTKVQLLAAAGLIATWIATAQTNNSPQAASQTIAAAREQAAAVTHKVQLLEDENAVENLQRSYGFFVDKALWQEAADLFAEDGTLEIGGRGVFVGKQRILDYLNWLVPGGLTPNNLFDHMQLQPIVHVAPDGNTAKGRWRFFGQVGEYQKSGVWGMGTYENEYVKQDGVWKIKTLHAYFRMYTPYADGWGKAAIPNTKPEKDLPPDRPPTFWHEQYPNTYIPDYHYKNPVTGK